METAWELELRDESVEVDGETTLDGGGLVCSNIDKNEPERVGSGGTGTLEAVPEELLVGTVLVVDGDWSVSVEDPTTELEDRDGWVSLVGVDEDESFIGELEQSFAGKVEQFFAGSIDESFAGKVQSFQGTEESFAGTVLTSLEALVIEIAVDADFAVVQSKLET
jgi:hypothetical protein